MVNAGIESSSRKSNLTPDFLVLKSSAIQLSRFKIFAPAGFVAEEVGRWLIEVQLLLEDLHLLAAEVTKQILLLSRMENLGRSIELIA